METKMKQKNQPQRLMLPLLREDVIQATSMTSPIDTAEEKGKSNKQNTAEIIELPKDTVQSTNCEVLSLNREVSIIVHDCTKDIETTDDDSIAVVEKIF
jgi:hypothetical protein